MKDFEKLISFIIPAFNASRTIKACLRSIDLLPWKESTIETIIIDDCSTDETREVVKRALGAYPNLVFLKQDHNGKQGTARNRGLSIAQGRYIVFVDADDEVVSDGIVNAVTAMEKSGTDICYFDFEYEMPQGIWTRFQMPQETQNTILSSEVYLNSYYTPYYNAPWRTVYRRSLLLESGIRFCEGVRWEDCDWTVKVYSQANRIQFVSGVGYRYAFNENATSRQKTPSALSERVYAGLRLMEFSREIQARLPGLSQTLSQEGRYVYITDAIRLRNLTKYTIKDIIELYKRIGDRRRVQLLEYKWPVWETLFFKSRCGALIVLFFACPIVYGVRLLLHRNRR